MNQVDDLGRKQGKWQKSYNDGTIRYEGQFRDDMPYGEFRYYYPSGELQAVNSFSDDGVVAQARLYYENGNLFAEGKYVNQHKQGTWTYYSEPDNKLLAREEYRKGELDGEVVRYYAETGQKLEVIHYTMGNRNGPYKKYFPNGQLMTEGNYKDDLLDDLFITYYPGGEVQARGYYREGRQIGNWEFYDEAGGILTREDFLIRANDSISGN